MANDWIMTRTGKHFRPFHPKIEDIEIEDIAHALSHICRFNGHTSKFYSVAEHSILVSVLCPEGLKLRGLLHDGAEAYMGDMPRPLKDYEFKVAEGRLLDLIYQKFDPPELRSVVDPWKGEEIIHRIDNQILLAEGQVLGLHPERWDGWPVEEWKSDMDLAFLIRGLPPDTAKRLFLAHFHSLTRTHTTT